jgi:hypothetical protein
MRKPGRQLIETWQHQRYKDKADIYLLKDNGTFTASYGEHTLTSQSLEKLRSDLRKLVESLTKLDWFPVVSITLSSKTYFYRDKKLGGGASTEEETEHGERAESGSARFTLDFKRFWLAKRADGNFLVCTVWHSQDDDGKSDNFNSTERFYEPSPRRLNASEFYLHGEDVNKFKLPHKGKERSFGNEQETHYVKYTPELWAGLNEIAFKIEDLAAKLSELIGTEKGIALVAGLVQKLLPAAKK